MALSQLALSQLALSRKRRNGFTFKRFFVAHEQCAMKVSTDSVILGSWTPLYQQSRILDIGTGCGLLALMLAQRTEGRVQIDAVELDSQACLQARENVNESPWSLAINVIECDAKQYLNYFPEKLNSYDLIVSNPPYFSQGVTCNSSARNHARYTISLDHKTLLNIVKQLLTPTGRFCVVLPNQIGYNFQAMAESKGWFSGHRLLVSDEEGKINNLFLMELSLHPLDKVDDNLVLHNALRQKTPEYRELTKQFYLAS